MKLTKAYVRHFEQDQEQNGTETALDNLVVDLVKSLLNDIGVKKMSITWQKEK